MTKIVLMGTPDYAKVQFEALFDAYPKWAYTVITQPDRPSGRGQKQTESDVKKWANSLGLPILQPETKGGLAQVVANIQPDLIIASAYGMILPKIVTDSFLCINCHGSLLPNYRGASPIQTALLNGDTKTGNTLIKMNDKMDEGDIASYEVIPIEKTDNFQSLHDKLAKSGARLLVDFIETQFIPRTFNFEAQDHKDASYCYKIKKSDLELTPQLSPTLALRKIRAFSPFPGAFLTIEGKRVKILSAQLEGKELVPITVKPEGKSTMSYSDYLKGNRAPIIFKEGEIPYAD